MMDDERRGELSMATDKSADVPEKDDPYHHGNVRRALLDATPRLIDARGVEGLTCAKSRAR